jgi:hypothetical protein
VYPARDWPRRNAATLLADDQASVQFVYAPHIAPKLDIIIENWKEQRKLKRRRHAPAVYDEASSTSSGPGDDKQGLEMKDIPVPLRITGIDSGLSASTLRRRPKPTASGLDDTLLSKFVRTSFLLLCSIIYLVW